MPAFDPEGFLGAVEEHKVSYLPVAPPLAVFLAKHPLVQKYDLSSVKMIFSGAAPLGPETEKEVEKLVDCKVFQGYGMTEMSPVSHLNPPSAPRTGSIGIAVCNTEAYIADENLDEVPTGERGELCVRGPNVMQEYLGNPEATAETLMENGYLRTGDIGYEDEDGYIFIVDRLKELIKVKGYQVAPAELEELLLSHPDVADAAVIGIPHERHGEAVKAFVVLKADAKATTDDNIKDYIAGTVADYKQISTLVFTDVIPKSASGKILRRMLKEPPYC